MGKIFDNFNNIGDKNPIEKYLKDRGFYDDTMHPRFTNGHRYRELSINKPCLRHDSIINGNCTLRIFINATDIYFEVETSYRSYKTSDRYNPKDYPTVSAIDSLLDEILERVW